MAKLTARGCTVLVRYRRKGQSSPTFALRSDAVVLVNYGDGRWTEYARVKGSRAMKTKAAREAFARGYADKVRKSLNLEVVS